MDVESKSGSYGYVEFDNDYAYKGFDDSNDYVFFREFVYLSLLSELKISKITGIKPEDFTIIMKRYKGTILDLAKKLSLDERLAMAVEIYRQVRPTIDAIHTLGLAHRDITIENIFYDTLNGKYEFYLADFSTMTMFVHDKVWKTDIYLYYDPDPESNNRENDLWIFGTTLFQFILGVKVVGEQKLKDGHLDFGAYTDIEFPSDIKEILIKLTQVKGRNRGAVGITYPHESRSAWVQLLINTLKEQGFDDLLIETLIGVCFYGHPDMENDVPSHEEFISFTNSKLMNVLLWMSCVLF